MPLKRGLNFRCTEERAIRQIRHTMSVMDWIEATGRDPEDENNWTDMKVEQARQYWLRQDRLEKQGK